MCTCKKNGRLKNLEGFFEYVGSPQNGRRASYEEVYEELLTSLYQLDNNGNKVIIDFNTASNKFVIDVNRPVYVGSLRDNSDSNFVNERCEGRGNSYNNIVNLGFKPANHEFPGKHTTLRSFIIDAEEDSVLPISYNEDADECQFSSNVRALCLPKVNFYIYKKYDSSGIILPQYKGYWGIKRNGYELIGNYEYPYMSEDTGAVDSQGRIIQRYKVSVLMLPIHNADSSKFKLLGHSNGKYGSEYDVDIEEYSFDSSVDYGQEVTAKGVYDLVHVNFVNADSNRADWIPTDSCQFLSSLKNYTSDGVENIPFGTRWDSKLNDIYCNVTGNIVSDNNFADRVESYKSDRVSSGIYNGISIAYKVDSISEYDDMYLYNLDTNYHLDITRIGDSITIPVKRLPVLDLWGILDKSDFDSTKEYIYVSDSSGIFGLYLTRYSSYRQGILLQVVSSLDNPTNLANEKYLRIYCSSTAPDENGTCELNDGNATPVYEILCKPTEMNGFIQYTKTKL